jgi:hypothetical protein
MTTDPAIISSHIAVCRPIGHDPPDVRLVKIDSPMVRGTSLVMVCVL